MQKRIAGERMETPVPLFPKEVDNCDRITAQFAMYHQQCGEQPTTVQCNFSDILLGQAQPFVRRVQVGDTPIRLSEIGNWVEQPGYLIIENRGSGQRQTVPSDAERELEKSKILLLRWEGATSGIVIRPKRLAVLELEGCDLSQLLLSAPVGGVPVNITIMPS